MSKRNRQKHPSIRVDKHAARAILSTVAKKAEERITVMVESGQARWPDSAFNLLTALAIFSIQVMKNRGKSSVSSEEIMQMATFIVTADEYTPGKHLPFTKEQMRQALDEIGGE